MAAFNPNVARLFVDGRTYRGWDHAEALNYVQCRGGLVLHTNRFRHTQYGLVGTMDDQDAARIQTLVPHVQYKRIPINHLIHMFGAKKFIREVEALSAQLG